MTSKFDQLSPRQRDCLRLVYQRRTSKEIARELGIQPGTVTSYCAEAIAILGAADRRHAAELLHEHEATAPSALGGQSGGVVGPAPDPPSPIPAGRRAHFLGPLFPGNRDADNDLSITTRLAWIVLLTVGIAIGFGSLAAAVRTFSDIARVGHVERTS